MAPTQHRPQLRLIRGGLDSRCIIGGVAVHLAAMEAIIPRLDAVVIEEDTFLVLSAEPTLQEPAQSLDELERELMEFSSPAPGSVLVRGGTPVEMLAIVHELDQSPSWREEWIATALENILDLAQQHRLRILAMPLLGTIHGRLPAQRFIALLRAALEHREQPFPTELWLAVPRQDLGTVRRLLGTGT